MDKPKLSSLVTLVETINPWGAVKYKLCNNEICNEFVLLIKGKFGDEPFDLLDLWTHIVDDHSDVIDDAVETTYWIYEEISNEDQSKIKEFIYNPENVKYDFISMYERRHEDDDDDDDYDYNDYDDDYDDYDDEDDDDDEDDSDDLNKIEKPDTICS